MIEIIGTIIKALAVSVLLHLVMTMQELNFNPLGRMVASVMNPVYMKFLKITKKRSDSLVPMTIITLTVIYGLLVMLGGGGSLLWSVYYAFDDMLRFLLIFYVVAILMGSTLNRFGASVYSTFLYRLALPVVKLTRSVINVPGNIIVIPAIILLFAAFIILDGGVHLAYMFAVKGGISFQAAWMGAVAGLVRTLLDLVTLLTWLIIIRVLMSWISPDPSNPVVQFIVAVTEPVMEPFRKIVPPVGFIDLSPIILIFALQFLKILLVKFAALVM